MNDPEIPPSFDPYQALAPSLKSGDEINRLFLLHPRRRIVQLLKGQRVLDAGCGTGSLAAMLAAAGCQVVGVDSSPTMLAYAQRKHIGVDFRQMDAARLPFQAEFDAAVISLALHEMAPHIREQVWESMRGAVRSAGQLIALDFALPRQNGLLTRLVSGLVERDERGTLSYHPEHYQNFQEFMRTGGLLSWIQKRSQPPGSEYRFWGGTLAVVVVPR